MGIADAKMAGSLERQQLLIEPDQIQNKLNDKNLRVLDVRDQDEYAKGHIPGALRVDVTDWTSLSTEENGLHNVEGWAQRVSPIGFVEGMEVVVYGTRPSDTARVWWVLKYLGMENVSILNGGWESWVIGDRPSMTSTPTIEATDFVPDFKADRLQEIDLLKKSLTTETVQIVDTRSVAEFTGGEVRGKRGGHIPGSVHLEWKGLLGQDGRFKTRDQLRQLFQANGILRSKTVVCY